MAILKSYKFRIYPNETQKILLEKHFGATRFIWNTFLSKRKKSYLEEKKNLTYYDNCKLLTYFKKVEGFEWLNEINSQSLQASLQDLDTAYGNFFKKQSKFPKFKSKHSPNHSFRCPQRVTLKENKLIIPKFKEGIKIKISKKISGKILYATISKTSTEKYFIAILSENKHIQLPPVKKEIGIDLGIKNLAICSDGKIIENIKTTKKYSKRLKYQQRQLSKKEKGSNKRILQRKKVALVHEKIKNVRTDHLHKASHSIISENQTIIIENLNVKGMIKNPHLAKSISDASWYEFSRQLEYKSNWNNRNLIKIDRWFPSSKMCNACGFINEKLTLADRKWICPKCKTVLDRDLNASKNILKQGLKILSGSGVESDIK